MTTRCKNKLPFVPAKNRSTYTPLLTLGYCAFGIGVWCTRECNTQCQSTTGHPTASPTASPPAVADAAAEATLAATSGTFHGFAFDPAKWTIRIGRSAMSLADEPRLARPPLEFHRTRCCGVGSSGVHVHGSRSDVSSSSRVHGLRPVVREGFMRAMLF